MFAPRRPTSILRFIIKAAPNAKNETRSREHDLDVAGWPPAMVRVPKREVDLEPVLGDQAQVAWPKWSGPSDQAQGVHGAVPLPGFYGSPVGPGARASSSLSGCCSSITKMEGELNPFEPWASRARWVER